MDEFKKILEWKQEYEVIYQMKILDQDFVFRPLGREEYKQIILMDLNYGEFQEAICYNAVIYPEDYSFSIGLAGIAVALSEAILGASGLLSNQAEELITGFREEMLDYDYQIDCMIHEAFPEIPIEEISSWSVRKTMYYLSRAEWILEKLKGISLVHIQEEQRQLLNAYANEQVAQQKESNESPQRPHIPPSQPESIETERNRDSQEESQLAQTEEEVLSMLQESGAKVETPITDLKEEMTPELNWFKHEDALKGDFD